MRIVAAVAAGVALAGVLAGCQRHDAAADAGAAGLRTTSTTTTTAGVAVPAGCHVMSMARAQSEFQAAADNAGQAGRTFAGRCVENHAFRMARAGDPADTVAKAAVDACDSAIGAAAQADYDAGKRVYGARALSFSDTQADVADQMSKKALAAVVTARANHCATIAED